MQALALGFLLLGPAPGPAPYVPVNPFPDDPAPVEQEAPAEAPPAEATPAPQVAPAPATCPCARVDWRCWGDNQCAEDAAPQFSDDPRQDTTAAHAEAAAPPAIGVVPGPEANMDRPRQEFLGPPPTGRGLRVGGIVGFSVGGGLLILGPASLVLGGVVQVLTLGIFGDGLALGGASMSLAGLAIVGASTPMFVVGSRRKRAYQDWKYRKGIALRPAVNVAGRGRAIYGFSMRF